MSAAQKSAETDLTPPKHPLASKTLWCHLLTLFLALIATCQGDEWVSQHSNWLQALLYLNIAAGMGLRMLTSQPLAVPSDKKMGDRKISHCWAFIFLSFIFLSSAASPADLPFASTALADDPTPTPSPAPVLILNLEAPQQISPGDLAVISVDPKSTAEDIQFTVVPLPEVAGNWQPRTTEAFLTNGMASGTFTIVAAGNLNGKTVIATTTVTFGVPTPPVPPAPPTPPTPQAASLWLVTVFDSTTLTASQSALLDNSAYWQGKTVLGAGHHYAEFGRANPAAAPYLAAVTKAGIALPAVVVMDASNGGVLGVAPLPSDATGVDAIIKTFTKSKSASKK